MNPLLQRGFWWLAVFNSKFPLCRFAVRRTVRCEGQAAWLWLTSPLTSPQERRYLFTIRLLITLSWSYLPRMCRRGRQVLMSRPVSSSSSPSSASVFGRTMARPAAGRFSSGRVRGSKVTTVLPQCTVFPPLTPSTFSPSSSVCMDATSTPPSSPPSTAGATGCSR